MWLRQQNLAGLLENVAGLQSFYRFSAAEWSVPDYEMIRTRCSYQDFANDEPKVSVWNETHAADSLTPESLSGFGGSGMWVYHAAL